jgi:hypothetical protein
MKELARKYFEQFTFAWQHVPPLEALVVTDHDVEMTKKSIELAND